jgi:glycosyltransferase involved in cell wall biosynthesis
MTAQSAPRVALVIPCFDDGLLLREAVASLAEHEPVERVIIDDGSSEPATIEALADIEASGWRIVRQRNTGLAGALQRGIAETVAPFVFRLDADDLLEPGALSDLADTLEANPEAGFAFGDFRFFGLMEGIWRSPPFDPWSVLYGNFWSPSVCFRRVVLEQVGGYATGWPYEDWNLYMRLASHGVSGVHCDRVTYRRRLQAGRMQEQQQVRHREIYRQMRAEHARLFARRGELVREVGPPRWKRVAYPLFLGHRYALPGPLYRLAMRTKLRRGTRRRS